MSLYAAHIRSLDGAKKVYEEAKAQYDTYWDNVKLQNVHDLWKAFSNYELLITQQAVSYSILDYINQGGQSRGSYLISEEGKKLTDYVSSPVKTEVPPCTKVQETEFTASGINCSWRNVRPIPDSDSWFENVWNDYLKGKHLNK